MRKLAYLWVCIEKILFRIAVALLYQDKKVRKAHLKDWTTRVEKKYLERYLYAIDVSEKSITECPKVIWVCWLQGFENAPVVVRKCLESLQKQCPDFEIKQITTENIRQYADIPEYIYQKYEQGKISRIQFSDLLRLALLSKNGGYWIDSTVFLSESLPQNILGASFFAYHCNGYLKSNSWFLKAAPEDMIIRNMKNLMFEYWKYENRLLNYFLYHLFFDLMMEKNDVLAAKWKNVPLLFDDCYELAGHFFEPFVADDWRKINEKTTIHKLNYKYDLNKPVKGTFLEKFLTDSFADLS